MKARRKGTKKIIEVEVLRPRMYRQKDKHGRVVEDFEEGELELLQELTQSTSDHWQDVRERAAIAVLPQCLKIVQDVLFRGVTIDGEVVTQVASMCVDYADALVEKLKGE